MICLIKNVRKHQKYLLAFVLVLGLAPSAYADVQMQIELGFNKHYVVNSFTPVRVQLTNQKHEGIRGWLEISQQLEVAPNEIVKETYGWPVELPPASKKIIQISMPIHAYTYRIQIVLRHAQDTQKVYQAQDIQLHKDYSPELQKLVLALSDVPFPHKLPTGESLQALGVEQLVNDSTGYRGVRRIYLGRIHSERLSAEQRKALKTWLLSGGELVIFSGENWYRQKSPFLEELIPMTVTDTSEIQLGGSTLTIVTGEPRGTVEAFVAPEVADRGEHGTKASVLLQAPSEGQGTPLLIRRSFGAGAIFFSTINPLAVEINGFWELLKPSAQEQEDENSLNPLEFLGKLELPVPSVSKVSGLVIVFIMGFGLLGLLAIKDKKYIGLLFIWVLLLSGIAAVYMSKPAFSKSLRALEAGICRSMNEAGTFCQLWYGVSSRKTADLSLLADSASVAQQLLPSKPGPHLFDARYAYATDGLRIFMRVDDRQRRHFYLESAQKASVTFWLDESEPTPVIKIVNKSDRDLFDAVFVKESRVFHLGRIKAKAVTETRLAAETPNYFQSFTSGNLEDKIKRTLLELARVQDLKEGLLAWSPQAQLVTDPREEKTVIRLIIVERATGPSPQ